MRIVRKPLSIGVIVTKYPAGYRGPRKRPYFPDPKAHRAFVKAIFAKSTEEELQIFGFRGKL